MKQDPATIDTILDESPPTTLRKPPAWVEDWRYSRNVYAWEDHDHPVDLLAWIDDALQHIGENPTMRRAVGAAVLATVDGAIGSAFHESKRSAEKQVSQNLRASRAWVDGKDVTPEQIEALERETSDEIRKLEVAQIDAAEGRNPLRDEVLEGYRWVGRAMRHALLPFAAMSGALASLVYQVSEVSPQCPGQLLANLRRYMPLPPAGYRQPSIPRRWIA